MSSLIFYTQPDLAIVATDTLAVMPDGRPAYFSTKANYLPHLRTIIAGTGAGGFSNQWALRAMSRMVLNGIRNLDYHAPKALCDLWAEYKKEHGINEVMTTTVYHFGICEESGQMVSFAYRSSSNFQSEELQFGTGVKPECEVPTFDNLDHLVNSIPTMMIDQREREQAKPSSERVYIGGEIHALVLTKDGCNCLNLAKFDDYESDKQRIIEGYANETTFSKTE